MDQSVESELELEPEQHLKKLLKQLEHADLAQLRRIFTAHFRHKQSCSVEDFAIYYLAAVRQHTELHFRNNGCNESDTPKNLTPVHQQKSQPADQEVNESQLSQLSQLSIGNVSTPVRQANSQQPPGRRSTGGTPQSTERTTNRSAGGGGGGGVSNVSGNSFCLGDFMLNSTPNQSQRRDKKKLTPQESANGNQSQKPRRRVLPMTISKNISASPFSPSFGDTSSFSNDNNLLRLAQSCELDRSQGEELEQEARKTLLLRRQQIKSEAPIRLEGERERERERERGQELRDARPLLPVNLEQVTHAKQLELLAGIYGLLMDLNLVPNVLSEISYAVQLLNIRATEPDDSPDPKLDPESPLSHLTGYRECIYFVVKFLEHQSDLLLQLDRKSLSMLLQHDRISLLSKQMIEELETACQRKQLQSKRSALPDTSVQQNVYYQHEKDSRDNFPSQQEFGAFKTQRDLFYKAFKQWEQMHFNRIFSFSRELGHSIREIFKQSEHPVNMAHFAKLFVGQLLMSSGDTHESPEELGLKLDQQRLNRLAQRLVTSNSSVEDQFPRTQAFFRDFINECNSLAFLVQLQLALYIQLLRHNDSSFELLPLQADTEEGQSQVGDMMGSVTAAPFIVREQALAELLLLAKFLGYVCAFPFNRSSNQLYACPQQLELRRHFQPPFEMHSHLERAMRQGKLLITLPWLVQYLVMLDLVTLQLPATLATLELLYALYASVVPNKSQPSLQTCAVFITRICLGWLLESQPVLGLGYYSLRSAKPSKETAAVVSECLRSLEYSDEGKAASLLERVLHVACPFLHKFCVSVAPSQRQVQRSGRFRYITTRLEQISGNKLQSQDETALNPAQADNQSQAFQAPNLKQSQRKLVDGFLHSQNPSMRRLLEFVTERSFKCVVKDAQQAILLPSKAASDALVNAISSTQQQTVQRELHRIYQQARIQAAQQWAEQVPSMLEERIEQSLRALLPVNTHEVVRRTYAHLIRQQAQPQLQQWLQNNVLQSNFYHGDLQELASKVCRSNSTNAQVGNGNGTSANDMCLLEAGDLSLSSILHELQQWVHCLSMRPDYLCYLGDLHSLLERTQQAVQLKRLPSYFYQLIGTVVGRLLQLLIYRQPHLLTESIISASCKVWLAPQLRSEETIPSFLETLLSVSFVNELSVIPARFQLLHQLLDSMLEAQVLSVDELNQLFITLFKENWTQPVWNELSHLLHQLSQNRKGNGDNNIDDGDEKAHLFMEMLADLSQDLDRF